MAFEVFTYSPSEIILNISTYRITGFERIAIQRNKSFTKIKGIRGSNSRFRDRDSACEIIIDLIQTSIANDVLSELVRRDLETNAVRLNLDLTDNIGSSKIISSNCFVDGYPELIYSGDIVYRRWSLCCLTTDEFRIGGNARLANNLFDEGI